MASVWKGIILGFGRDATHPRILSRASFLPSSTRSCFMRQCRTVSNPFHPYFNSHRRYSSHGNHRVRSLQQQQQLISLFDFTMATKYPSDDSLQERGFQTTSFLNEYPRESAKRTSKKDQINSSVSKQDRAPPPLHKIAAGIGMTLEECSDYLVKECSEMRYIKLNKRQRLKPWIMALLVHRYDRGIRDIDELNTDSVYYNGGSKTTNTVVGPSIDLRSVLTPSEVEINGYIVAKQNQMDSNGKKNVLGDREQIREILRQEKLALLATEARRILIDREIPFQDLADLKNEGAVRKLSKQDPSIFLSLFSRAFCVSEKRKHRRSKKGERPNFSHRRNHPPSLKSTAYKNKQLKEKRNRELAEKNRQKAAEEKNYHSNSPRALQQKLRAMSQRNRRNES